MLTADNCFIFIGAADIFWMISFSVESFPMCITYVISVFFSIFVEENQRLRGCVWGGHSQQG